MCVCECVTAFGLLILLTSIILKFYNVSNLHQAEMMASLWCTVTVVHLFSSQGVGHEPGSQALEIGR